MQKDGRVMRTLFLISFTFSSEPDKIADSPSQERKGPATLGSDQNPPLAGSA